MTPMAASKAIVLEITIISAKHLKNVNWRNGDLKPYATFYLDYSEPRQATRVDDSGSTRPVWNERFTVPLTRPVHESILTLEIFHSKPSETPKPLVGTVKFPLSLLIDSDESSSLSSSTSVVRKLELIRPSGRPQGKVRVKLAVKEAPLPPTMLDYANTPNYSHYYNPTPSPPLPPPPARDYREFSPSPYGYSDHYGYYSAYYPPPPPPPQLPLTSRPMYSRLPNYSIPGGPSAPVDLSLSSSYDHKPPPALKTSSYMVPSGPSAPVDYTWPSATRGGSAAEVSSTMEGLSLEEENIYEKEKAADRGTYNYRREY